MSKQSDDGKWRSFVLRQRMTRLFILVAFLTNLALPFGSPYSLMSVGSMVIAAAFSWCVFLFDCPCCRRSCVGVGSAWLLLPPTHCRNCGTAVGAPCEKR